MRLKREVILLMCLVFLISILPPVSPANDVYINFQAGYDIVSSRQSSLKSNENFTVNFFVYNKSDGNMITNAVSSCSFYLADNTGSLLFYSKVPYNPLGYWAIKIDGKNFTEAGQYNYGIKCNSSAQGGTSVGLYEISHAGIELTQARATIDIGLLALMMLFFILSIFMFVKFENLLARVGSFGLGYLLLIAISFISWNMANDFLISAPFIVSMFRIIFLVLVIGLFPLIIGGFAYYFIMISRIKEIDDLMKHGISVSEAQERSGYKHGRNR
jgi:hypothetical protein